MRNPFVSIGQHFDKLILEWYAHYILASGFAVLADCESGFQKSRRIRVLVHEERGTAAVSNLSITKLAVLWIVDLLIAAVAQINRAC